MHRVQLNRFQDGEYAIGVSCTALLADPLSLTRFLLEWARIHVEIKEKNKTVLRPMMQYMAYFQRPEICCKRIRSFPIGSAAACLRAVLSSSPVLPAPPLPSARRRRSPSHRLLRRRGTPLLDPGSSLLAGDCLPARSCSLHS